MATPAQIDEQIQHERDAIQCGIDKLLKDNEKLIDRNYASATVFGVSSISEAQSIVAQTIVDTFEYQIKRGKNGVAYADIHTHLTQFNDIKQANILANIALKRTFDLVFAKKKKNEKFFPNSISNVTVSVGASVEDECKCVGTSKLTPNYSLKSRKSTGSTQLAQNRSVVLHS